MLDQLPCVGAVFGTTGKTYVRTELIIFIRPQIIRDGVDASMVAEELARSCGAAGRRRPLFRPC